MEKYAWKARVAEGKTEEYRRRHNEIWDEMVRVLKDAGICNYTIWTDGTTLFGYYECERGVAYAARVQKGIEYAVKVQAESPTVKKWDKYMEDILIMEKDPVTGAQPALIKVFELD